MSKSPWNRRRRNAPDWPLTIVTALIVVMSAVLTGSLLSIYLQR